MFLLTCSSFIEDFHIDLVNIDNDIFKLHYKFTATILLIFSVVVTSTQYIAHPISCTGDNLPQELVNTYCWITSTFIPQSKETKSNELSLDVPKEDVVKHQYYYQWVCFILLIQAVLFMVPWNLWKNYEDGRMRELASDAKFVWTDDELIRNKYEFLVNYFYNNLNRHNWYCTIFVICEFLNLLNVIVQMFLMNWFLNGQFLDYGLNVVKNSVLDQEDRSDPMAAIFPKVTKCIFYKFGSSGSLESHDSLCVLPINIINEKIFIFNWFWFLTLACVTVLGLIYRFAILLKPSLRYKKLKSKLRTSETVHLRHINHVLNFGDWFIFYQVIVQLDYNMRKHLVQALANKINGVAYNHKNISIDDKSNDIHSMNATHSVCCAEIEYSNYK